MAQINLITQYDRKSPVSEAYRAIRTNLQFAGAGKPLKLVGFTSAVPSEGKSTTVSNLAVTVAQDGKRVLLVDCDMRRPIQHKLFGIPNRGLSNCIATDIPVQDVIQRDVFHNLDILSSGPVPPNPAELIGSKKMCTILQTIGDGYDYVFLDMPPVLPVTDAAILASKADGTIIVLSAGKTLLEEAKQTKLQLQKGQVNILGVILNKVPVQHRYGYNYNYYYYYYYDEDHAKHKGHRNKKSDSE